MRLKHITPLFLFICLGSFAQTPWLTTGNAIASGNYLGTTNNEALSFRTSGIQAMTINGTNQNIDINNLNQPAKLGVLETNGSTGIHVRNTSGNQFFKAGLISEVYGASSLSMIGVSSSVVVSDRGFASWNVTSHNSAGTGTESYGVYAEVSTNPNVNDLAYAIWGRVNQNAGPSTSYAGFFEGKTWCTSGWWNGSDALLKDDINDLSSNLEIVNLLQPKKYRFQ